MPYKFNPFTGNFDEVDNETLAETLVNGNTNDGTDVLIYAGTYTGTGDTTSGGTTLIQNSELQTDSYANVGSTLNPSDKGVGVTLSGGDLTAAFSGSWRGVRSINNKTSGVVAYSVTINTVGNGVMIGFGNSSASLSLYAGSDANGIGYWDSGSIYYNNGQDLAPNSYTTGDVILLAYAEATNTFYCWKQTGGTGSFASEGTYTSLNTSEIYALVSGRSANVTVDFSLPTGEAKATLDAEFGANSVSAMTFVNKTSGALTLGNVNDDITTLTAATSVDIVPNKLNLPSTGDLYASSLQLIGPSPNYQTGVAANLSILGGANSITSGTGNIGIGSGATDAVTTTSGNIGIGNNALTATTGSNNTALGYSAGSGITTTSHNISIGYNSMTGANSADRNVAVGAYSLQNVGSADYNIGIGYAAGDTSGIGNENVIIGYFSDVSAGVSDTIVLGSQVTGTASNTVYLGNTHDVIVGGDTTLGGKLDVTKALTLPYLAITGATTLDDSHHTVDCTANTFTVTLPTAVGIAGRIYNIKNSGNGAITIDGNGSETIDGQTTQTITEQYVCVTVQSTGTAWIII